MKTILGIFTISLCPYFLWAQTDYKDLYRINFTERKLHLDEVIITADGVADPKDQERVKTTQTIDDYLLRLGGIDMIMRGVYASEPVYRGMAGDRAPVTINNMKIFGACTDKMDPVSSYVALNNLKAIRVINNAASGNSMNATAGVIDLATKMPIISEDMQWNLGAGTGYKSVNNEANGQFNAGYTGSKMGFLANGTFRNADNYIDGNGKEVPFSQYQKTNLSLAASYKLSDASLIKAEYIFDLAQDVGYPALPMDVSSARGNIYGITIEQFFAKFDFRAKIYGSNIEHIMDDSQRDVIMRMDMPGWSNTYGTFFELNNKINNLELTSTFDYYQNQSLAEMTMYPDGEAPMFMLTWPNVHKNSISLSSAAAITLSEKKTINFAARLEATTSEIKDDLGVRQLEAIGIVGTSGNNFLLPSVSLGFTYKLNKNTFWNISGSYGLRQPSVSEGFGFYLFNNQDNYDYLGDPRLKAEGSLKAETGLRSGNDVLNWNVQGFYYYMPNYIIGIVNSSLSPMTIGASGVKEYRNIAYGFMTGAEFGFTIKPLSWLTFSTTGQYTYGLDDEGIALPMVPPLKNSSELYFSGSRVGGYLKVKSALAQNNPRVEFGEEATPGYAITSIGAQYGFTLNRMGIVVAAEADNIFDMYYWDHLDFNSIPRPGRSFNLSLVLSYR